MMTTKRKVEIKELYHKIQTIFQRFGGKSNNIIDNVERL